MIQVKKNEADAEYRRVYFQCVDVTDGITAETGEAGGQPQISIRGAAWSSIGIGTLVAIGNGRYYAELTQAQCNISDRSVIESRYKSANTAEAPGTTVQIFDPIALESTSQQILSELTTVSGTGTTAVNHNTGGADNLRFLDGGGNGIDDAEIKAYLKTDYDAGNVSAAYVKGRSQTVADGRWEWPINLDPGFTYAIVFSKQGSYQASKVEITL